MMSDVRRIPSLFRSRRVHAFGLSLALCALAFGNSTALAQAVASADTAGSFLEEFRRAHEAKDVDAAMRLVYWNGAEPATKQTFAANFKDDFAMTIDKVEFAPTPPSQITRYTRNGKTYKTNLEVRKIFVVRFKAQPGATQVNSTTYLIGEKEGRYFITPAVPGT